MEYFKVRFDPKDIRDVRLNGAAVGQTEGVLIAAANDYVITLSDPQNYQPSSQDVQLAGTTDQAPLIVTFTRNAGV
jgi:hypothetical protein